MCVAKTIPSNLPITKHIEHIRTNKIHTISVMRFQLIFVTDECILCTVECRSNREGQYKIGIFRLTTHFVRIPMIVIH